MGCSNNGGKDRKNEGKDRKIRYNEQNSPACFEGELNGDLVGNSDVHIKGPVVGCIEL